MDFVMPLSRAKRNTTVLLTFVAFAILPSARSLAAGIVIPGANGVDGAFTATNTPIDLTLAKSGPLETTNPNAPGQGVYDPAKWAVVFRYTSVTIPVGVTLTFKNNASNAPVVWLVNGDVTITGTVDLSGGTGHGNSTPAVPGPGGFRGGVGGGEIYSSAGTGFGPGGPPLGDNHRGNFGDPTVGPPSYGTPYSNAQVLALIGGSGGGGNSYGGYGGGAGGGAILIAATGTITINGTLQADGGNSDQISAGGSGGAIRLVSDKVAGSGSLLAHGNGSGAVGRIRVEANTQTLSGPANPSVSFGVPNSPTADIWPPSSFPSLAITFVGSTQITDPHASFATAGAVDATLPSAAPTVVKMSGTNVPTNWNVVVRLVPVSGADSYSPATLVSGDSTSSMWVATINPSQNYSAIQARAYKP